MIRKSSVNILTITSEQQYQSLFLHGNHTNLIHEIKLSKPYGKYDLSKIPSSVYKLIFNYKYENNPMEIPCSIKEVSFYIFDYPLENLPTNINHVFINQGFNHVVDNLGNNFITIDFGRDFNQNISNLPSSLEKIVLGTSFTHSINNLPDNIKFIHLRNCMYEHNSIFKLPKSIILFQLSTINESIELELNVELSEGKKYYGVKENNFDFSTGNSNNNNYYLNSFYFFNS